jgi:glucose-1-phosphate cytidylyltransferase
LKAVILAGGQGARLGPLTRQAPKPLIEIGGRPMIDLVVAQIARSGVSEVIVAAGHQADRVRAHFDANRRSEGPRIDVVDTGTDAGTAGRIRRVREHLNRAPFLVAYCDCLSDLDVSKMRARHAEAGRTLTVMSVRPRLPFGLMDVEDGLVTAFEEKPLLRDRWVNGGTFVASPELFDAIDADSEMLEGEPMARLVGSAQVAAYKHVGFWHAVNTPAQHEDLQHRFDSGSLHWLEES